MPSPELPKFRWGAWGLPWSPWSQWLPRLTLAPALDRDMFDGAWWPRTDNAQAELTDLVTAVSAHIGPIVRVGIHRAAWRSVPHAVLAETTPVKVNALSTTPHTVHLTRSLRNHILLLVVPPDADAATAATAMARAVSAGCRESAAELLAGLGLGSEAEEPGASG